MYVTLQHAIWQAHPNCILVPWLASRTAAQHRPGFGQRAAGRPRGLSAGGEQDPTHWVIQAKPPCGTRLSHRLGRPRPRAFFSDGVVLCRSYLQINAN